MNNIKHNKQILYYFKINSMLIKCFLISLVVIFFSCSSSDEKAQELSKTKAKDLVRKEMTKTEDGGTQTIVNDISIQSIKESEGIYTIEFTWSGTTISAEEPDEKDNEDREEPVENAKGSLQVEKVNKKWEVVY